MVFCYITQPFPLPYFVLSSDVTLRYVRIKKGKQTCRTVRATHAPCRSFSSDSSRASMLKPIACEVIRIDINVWLIFSADIWYCVFPLASVSCGCKQYFAIDNLQKLTFFLKSPFFCKCNKYASVGKQSSYQELDKC